MNSENISENEQKKDFENLKSDYFLINLFDITKKNKSLKIMKYNKNLQKRLNININDYKECSEVEIELKFADGKYDQFINIPDEDKEYYHIYLGNSNEEIKKCNLEKNEKVKMIKIIIDYQVKSFKGLFDNCNYISKIFFNKFYRINITDMSEMFYGCLSLKELNLSNFNTNNVTNMSHMFRECSSLKKLNLSNFNSNNVTNMCKLFEDCSSLKDINLSNFNTNNVTNMYGMFDECLDELKLKIKSQFKNFKEEAFLELNIY